MMGVPDVALARPDLGFLLEECLAGHDVGATTRAGYVRYIERFIQPTLGDQTLGRLAQHGHGSIPTGGAEYKQSLRDAPTVTTACRL